MVVRAVLFSGAFTHHSVMVGEQHLSFQRPFYGGSGYKRFSGNMAYTPAPGLDPRESAGVMTKES